MSNVLRIKFPKILKPYVPRARMALPAKLSVVQMLHQLVETKLLFVDLDTTLLVMQARPAPKQDVEMMRNHVVMNSYQPVETKISIVEWTRNTEYILPLVMVTVSMTVEFVVLISHILVKIKESFADQDITSKNMQSLVVRKRVVSITLNLAVQNIRKLVKTKMSFVLLVKPTKRQQPSVRHVRTMVPNAVAILPKLAKINKLCADQVITAPRGLLKNVLATSVTTMHNHVVLSSKLLVEIKMSNAPCITNL